MPQITSIEPQKKKKNRFNIYIDGIFAIGVDASAILTYNLKIGKKLSQQKLNEVLFKGVLNKYMDKVLHFLGFRPRSEKEVVDYLVKKISISEEIKFSQAKESRIIPEIIKKLKKYQYINDEEFASWLYKSKLKNKPTGKLPIKLELIRKGISSEIIEKTLGNYPNEISLAKKSVIKKIKYWKKLDNLTLKKKIYSHLSSRGFNYDTIQAVFAFFKKKN